MLYDAPISSPGERSEPETDSDLRDEAARASAELAAALAKLPLEDAEEGLTSDASLLRRVLDRLPFAVTVKDAEGRYVFVNRPVCHYFGRSRRAVLGRAEEEVSFDRDLARRSRRDDQEVLRSQRIKVIHEEPFTDPRGQPRWFHTTKVPLTGTSADPAAKLVLTVSQEITAQKLAGDQIRHRALHDPLTGLPNRVLFLERLRVALERHRRLPGYRFAVLFLDLDDFKRFNDSRGHATGDRMLKEVAAALTGSLRKVDLPARFGGDEFTVLLEDLDSWEQAQVIARRILRRFADGLSIGEATVRLSASIGIAEGRSHYRRPEELIRDADAAMYRAKDKDRDGATGVYSVYPADPREADSLSVTAASPEAL